MSNEATIRPTFVPPGFDQDERAGTLVLRDGSRLPLLRAVSEDAQRILAFFDRLPEGEREAVSQGLGIALDELPGLLERISDRGTGDAFLAEDPDAEQIVAVGLFHLSDHGEVGAIAFAVAEDLRGLGVASLLLERLAVVAARRGVRRLEGAVHEQHEALRHVLRHGGFRPSDEGAGGTEMWVLDPRQAGEDDTVARRMYTASSLHGLFHPRSVAVVGASREPSAVGHRILVSLIRSGFEGPVYPVNPKAEHVASVRAWPSLTDIGRPVDLAVIAVPAKYVPQVIDECAEVGVRGIVLVSAGFAEVGADGRALQDEIVRKVREHDIRMVGPNCLGLIHTDPEVRLNASFAPEMPPTGRIGLSSQSGALGIAIIALAKSLGLGLSGFVSVGNKADVSGNDLVEYWEEDPNTDVILLYLESFGNPRRFARIARRVGRFKPIVTVKAGRTEAGSRAASSHTAALSAADTGVAALLEQTGVIRADTLEEMFGIARALTEQPLPRGRRVGIVTNAGGPAILVTDALEAAGLEVVELSDDTQAKLQQFLPPAASTRNPVDMIASADPEGYRRSVEVVLASDDVDALVVIYTPVGMYTVQDVGQAVADGVEAAREATGATKPVYGSIVGQDEREGGTTFQAHTGAGRVPIYPFPEVIGKVLGKVVDYVEWRSADVGLFPEFSDQQLEAARALCQQALEERGAGWLSADEVSDLLDAVGLQQAPGGLARDAVGAARIASEIGFPVAVKLASLQISHKTDIGGVMLGLESAPEVEAAFRTIRRRVGDTDEGVDAMEGVIVQPMIDGAEVMIGVNADSGMGPLVAFGLGGIHVEILRDVVFRVSPLTDRDAREMVRSIRGYRLLQGYRGHPPADVEALEQALLRISRLVETVPEIRELDLNPLFALEPGEGYRVVDARIKVGPPAGGKG